MKLQYIGESFGVDSLTSNKIYECVAIEYPFVRVIDDSDEDYLYSASNPGSLDEPITGRWKIIEDNADGSLSKIIPPLD